MTLKIRTLIADDELLIRERIKDLLSENQTFELVAECNNGSETIKQIKNLKPDLAFLDIRMPEKNGFEVLEALNPNQMPVIVFITAYSDYSLKAFDAHAIDYILKPIDKDRFHNMLDRIIKMFDQKVHAEVGKRLSKILKEELDQHLYPDRLTFKEHSKISIVKTETINLVESDGNYIKVYAGDDVYRHRDSITNFEKKLDPARFVRVHRSFLVNVDFIRQMHHLYKGEYAITLKNGRQISTSKTYKANISRILEVM